MKYTSGVESRDKQRNGRKTKFTNILGNIIFVCLIQTQIDQCLYGFHKFLFQRTEIKKKVDISPNRRTSPRYFIAMIFRVFYVLFFDWVHLNVVHAHTCLRFNVENLFPHPLIVTLMRIVGMGFPSFLVSQNTQSVHRRIMYIPRRVFDAHYESENLAWSSFGLARFTHDGFVRRLKCVRTLFSYTTVFSRRWFLHAASTTDG